MRRRRAHLLLACGLLFTLITMPATAQSCPELQETSVALKGRTVSVQRVANAIIFRAGMDIDADGAPNAYGPNDSGLDYTSNAKDGDKWVGVVTHYGKPIVQSSGPYQGLYVSTTALRVRGVSRHAPDAYADATKVPYIVLPPQFFTAFGVRLGDFAVVRNARNGKTALAVFADVGPGTRIGEGSMALANALGVDPDPRRGGVDSGIVYLVFPQSGHGQGVIPAPAEITTEAAKLLAQWGGPERLDACTHASAGQEPR